MRRTLAPVKINLCLHVGNLRPDGLHELSSLAAILPLGDELELSPAADTLSLEITGPFAADLAQISLDENLVMRAARALQRAGGITSGAHILLTKKMPLASGLGAGTADAAATLFLLRSFWQLPLDDEALMGLAFELGADGPLCLLPHLTKCSSVFVRGAGEYVTPGPALPKAWACLVNPGTGLSTAEVFARYDQEGVAGDLLLPDLSPETDQETDKEIDTLSAFMRASRNDLQSAAVCVCPQIEEVLALLTGSGQCLGARMSGSGATCFGLYPSRQEAEAVAATAADKGWWQGVAPLGKHLLQTTSAG